MASDHSVHDAASKGFHNAQSYDAHRPSYGDAAVSSLLKHLGLEGKENARIVDLAAGTGKFTEVLAARPEEFEIIAVEPLDPMRETLAEKRLKGVEVQGGTASDMNGVQAAWADGVIVAQAFHWFAKEESLKEIHRVLKPGAKLGLIWNVEDYNRPESWPATTEWERELEILSFSGHFDEQPRFRHLQWLEIFEQQAKAEQPLFSTPLGTDRVRWSVWLTRGSLWDRINTLSWNAVREGESRLEFEEKFDEILKNGDGNWNDKGEVEVHACTFFAWSERL
ncbi:S-adenosyl-L-methionine-dependent methyltransferase [Thelonectria olida]|uniref:S-adenosyl-L-methionine-dependent methyltransferase n=1 Tax=Thelonectria olida TaxID=1576542 RepID=A0A9P8WFI8_9HYPO|nr:S-adenosyl-L-methionine-dependent methyltransferase [Thelonectria olida]